MTSNTPKTPKPKLRKSQLRRAEALALSQALIAGGPALFSGTPAKLERKVDDLMDVAEFILEGDRTWRSRDGDRLMRYSPGYDGELDLNEDA